ncbi:glycosyltransferase [Magnetovibrio blakemorei]|uniref:Glycosyl transferase family 1 domain-containing protein n=1 Tax=Magnetovibrio blakemorei TaxID=28181 RepID=A0A1E5Q636_9PROT|nr:glycosyltransferase family 1 protein [Magnetovibrio blakemorei]OEJ66073.1 hypothetical protein BEN30_13045 [Magnetovibrio blakemorei]OEJ66110.1 hypothetical protein BEN30_12955 [Magnetovibrio blakemorei]
MKIAIGYTVVEGPWGGGNRFVAALRDALLKSGHLVVHDLRAPDIDIILIIDPRTRIPNIPFGAGSILRYLAFRNPKAVVIHRINECDERKNTRTINFRLRLANYAADHTVFVGSWLENLSVWRKCDGRGSSVILNGADPDVFNMNGHKPWDRSGPLKLVTHHWGGNWMKGFDVYQKLDQMLSEPTWSDRIAFTYIGNVPKGFAFQNTTHLAPLDAYQLANELRSHHVYVTASIFEPGGNHQNEGALCGLPLLYRDSGCMPEYCNDYGVMFDGPDNIGYAINRMMDEYDTWYERISSYPCTIQNTVNSYLECIKSLHGTCEEVRKSRHIWRNPFLFLLNQIPF